MTRPAKNAGRQDDTELGVSGAEAGRPHGNSLLLQKSSIVLLSLRGQIRIKLLFNTISVRTDLPSLIARVLDLPVDRTVFHAGIAVRGDRWYFKLFAK